MFVNTAQVKNWGSGEPADLGELQVESFSQELVSDHSKPFYEQLARRLEELQVSTAGRVVSFSLPRLPTYSSCICMGSCKMIACHTNLLQGLHTLSVSCACRAACTCTDPAMM